MSETVSIRVQLNDGGSFKDISVNAEDLAKAINTVKDKADDLGKSLVSMASISQIAEGLQSAMGSLLGAVSGLSSAYSDQLEGETKLATAMRNTMSATDGEIQSIKDLVSAQQQLGIVGDEVQLAGAQELATYLEYSDSLKSLIPVLNDMTAQQYGYNATAESSAQIATMLGKVMNGQTEALSRYGYKFDEAQKQILRYGTESERAAVLTQVVEEAVGGMNEALAKTPAGRLVQTRNALGDMREEIGLVVINLQPTLEKINAMISAGANIAKAAQAVQAFEKCTAGAKVQALFSNVEL